MKRITLAFSAITLSVFFAPLGSAANLVLNGNFATGDYTDWTISTPPATDSDPNPVPGSDPYYMTVSSLVPASASDSYGAVIGAYYDDTSSDNPVPHIQGSMSQSFNTMIGQEYTISFVYGEFNTNPSLSTNNPYDPSDPDNLSNCSMYGCYLDPPSDSNPDGNVTSSNDPDSNPWAQNNDLNVLIDGGSVFSASNFFTSANPNATTNQDSGESIGDFFYQQGSATFTATGTTTTLEFDGDDYQQGVILDDIDVEATAPEPGTVGLLGSALLGLGFLARRRGVRRG